MTGDGAAAPDAPTVPPEFEVTFVVAIAENGVIGDDGTLPWHFPEDLKRFKETTTGHPVIMGRRTYESIASELGGPLPGRTNVVLTRSTLDLPAGAVVANDLQEAIDRAVDDARERDVGTIHVVGGANVYEQFLPVTDRLIVTVIHGSYEGDTRFPEWETIRAGDGPWVEVERDEREELSFVEYEREPASNGER